MDPAGCVGHSFHAEPKGRVEVTWLSKGQSPRENPVLTRLVPVQPGIYDWMYDVTQFSKDFPL